MEDNKGTRVLTFSCKSTRFLLEAHRAVAVWLCLSLFSLTTSAMAGVGAGGRVHWNAAKQGKFVTALCRDHQGNLWAGTEDHGVWEYHVKTHKWQQFTVASTGGNPASSKLGPVLTAGTPNEHALGDNHIYAIACDKLGRIWVGHLNHGVSVYNGKSWENYDVINGPLGERVFDIATSPVDGDVWIATDEGLARYSLSHDKWLYYTRAPGPGNQGLPSNQIEAIAFGKDGTLYAATQCCGLAICKPVPNYNGEDPLVSRQWRTVTSKYIGSPPLIPMGRGLPSNLLNDVMVAHDGTVWVATDEGLAWSKDQGQSWKFIRGHHWQAKDEGLYPPKVTSAQVQAVAKKYAAGHDLLLSEDRCTALAEDGDGDIWIGHWRSGIEMIDPHTGKHYQSRYDPLFQGGKKKKIKNAPFVRQGPTDDVFSLLALPDQPPVIGFYGGGLVQMPDKFTPKKKVAALPDAKAHRHPPQTVKAAVPKLPSPAKPLATAELKQLIAKVKLAGHRATPRSYSALKNSAIPRATYLGDDWMTQGDEVGHYGRQCGILCASGGIADNNLTFNPTIKVVPMQGLHARQDDGLRRWVQWLTTDNINSLYAPWIGSRIQASCDDHGEAYKDTFDGPGLAIALALPSIKGAYRLSLYFFNKDGHTRSNRMRDYVIEVYHLPQKRWKDLTPPPHSLPRFPKNAIARQWYATSKETKPLAKARVFNFRGGVYKQFLLSSPGDYMIVIRRNYSFNTILSGFFLDRLAGKATSHFAELPPAGLGDIPYVPPKASIPVSATGRPGGPGVLDTAADVWQAARAIPSSPQNVRIAKLMAYRAAEDAHAPDAPDRLLGRWRWFLNVWTVDDRRHFNAVMVKGYAKFKQKMARQAALQRAMDEAKKNGSKTFVWRGSWADPATQPAQ